MFEKKKQKKQILGIDKLSVMPKDPESDSTISVKLLLFTAIGINAFSKILSLVSKRKQESSLITKFFPSTHIYSIPYLNFKTMYFKATSLQKDIMLLISRDTIFNEDHNPRLVTIDLSTKLKQKHLSLMNNPKIKQAGYIEFIHLFNDLSPFLTPVISEPIQIQIENENKN